MKKELEQKNKGFTLVETLVAISIFTVSILALFSILARGISDTNYAKRKIVAAYLAQEGVESIRNMRDTYVLYTDTTQNDWGKFQAKLAPCNLGNECGFNNGVLSTDPSFIFKCSSSSNGCNLYLNNGSYNTNSIGSDSGYVRKIWMLPIGNGNTNEVRIFSQVSWAQNSGNYNIVFSEDLFNWVE